MDNDTKCPTITFGPGADYQAVEYTVLGRWTGGSPVCEFRFAEGSPIVGELLPSDDGDAVIGTVRLGERIVVKWDDIVEIVVL